VRLCLYAFSFLVIAYGDPVIVAVVDDALLPDFRLGDSPEVFVRRDEVGWFIEEVRGDDPEVAAKTGSRSSRRTG